MKSLAIFIALIAVGLSYWFVDINKYIPLQKWMDSLKQTSPERSLDEIAGKTCTATDYLTDHADVKGFHILCMTYGKDQQIHVTAYLHGRDRKIEYTFSNPLEFRTTTQEALGIKDISELQDANARKYKQPWRVFTTEGNVIHTMAEMLTETTVFLFEGGQWIWPGVREGYKFQIKGIDGFPNAMAETLSMQPLVFKIEDFLTDDECELIKKLSLPHLKASGVSLMDKDKGKPAEEWRTSSTYFLSSKVDPKLKKIDQRCAQLTKVNATHQEDAQVLRYEHTQKYDAHHDYFSPSLYQQSPHILESIEYGFKNRMITVFWYMSDVAKGGHTIFPRAGGLPPPTSYKDCSKGLKVAPKKRMVTIFYSMLPNGDPDPLSLHGGCPVEEGVKFAVNKWVWNKPRHHENL